MEKKIQFIQITPDQLKDAIIEGVKNQLDDLKKSYQPKEPTEFLTRNEVAELLKISLATVHHWSRKGKIKAYGISGRVYYKRKEIENTMIEL